MKALKKMYMSVYHFIKDKRILPLILAGLTVFGLSTTLFDSGELWMYVTAFAATFIVFEILWETSKYFGRMFKAWRVKRKEIKVKNNTIVNRPVPYNHMRKTPFAKHPTPKKVSTQSITNPNYTSATGNHLSPTVLRKYGNIDRTKRS